MALVRAQVWELVGVRVARVADWAKVWVQVRALVLALVAALERVEVQGWVLEGPV